MATYPMTKAMGHALFAYNDLLQIDLYFRHRLQDVKPGRNCGYIYPVATFTDRLHFKTKLPANGIHNQGSDDHIITFNLEEI